MTSHAALTHAVAPAFNADFYTTVATIIPVLFIALAVQGNTNENLLNAQAAVWQYTAGRYPFIVQIVAKMICTALLGAAALIVIFAAFTEALALYVLYQRQASTSTSQTILSGVVIMSAATAASPALKVLRAFILSFSEPSEDPRPPGRQALETSKTHAAAQNPGKPQDNQPQQNE